MAAVSLKCPHCDGELIFEPSSQQYECPYCGSVFTQKQVDEMQPASQPSQMEGTADFREEEKEAAGFQAQSKETEEAMVYHCPSCGAEIVTDATTAATFCYYCHNPVVLSGRVSGEYLPKKMIPFKINRKKAEEIFLESVQKKKFIPKGFFNTKQIETLSGVYFPYWMVNWKGRGHMDARATKVRVWRRGDTEYTETRFYEVYREANLEFDELSRNALKKANKQIVEGVQPYRFEEAKPFSMGYLSGFQAERRDMEQEEFQDEIRQDVEDYTQKIFRNSMSGYTTVDPRHTQMVKKEEIWEYVMVPVWVVTYKGTNGKIYYYAINGQTGKVSGVLPIDGMKLGLVSAGIFAAVGLLGLLGGFLL